LSVDADHEMVAVVCVAEVIFRFEGVLGGCVSEQAAVVALTAARVEWLPAASKASTENVYVVPQARPEAVYDVAVVVPRVAVSRNTVYPATPVSSVAAVQVIVTAVCDAFVTESADGVVGA